MVTSSCLLHLCILTIFLLLPARNVSAADDEEQPHFTAQWMHKISDLGQLVREDTAKLWHRSLEKVQNLANCPYGECCVPEFIPADFEELHRNLTADLYGQHIVIDILSRSLRAHFAANSASGKPLVLSLHGQSGTGKTFVAQLIASHMFRRGMASRFVHQFVGRASFPLVAELATYQRQLKELVELAVRQCDRSLFIFDEVEKMPVGILENISGLLNHQQHIAGVDYRRATFVLISNSHGEEVAEELRGWEVAGGLRQDMRSAHFERVLKLIAFNAGGLRQSALISEDLVDHYVPFLPLERRHVKQCVRREMRRRGVLEPGEELVDQIATEAATYSENYSISGCKRIDKAVAYHAVEL